MSLTLPPSEMLETPPGYPFEEINYEDIEVEEVGATISVSVCVAVTLLLNADSSTPVGGWQRSVWGGLQSQVERQRRCHQDH